MRFLCRRIKLPITDDDMRGDDDSVLDDSVLIGFLENCKFISSYIICNLKVGKYYTYYNKLIVYLSHASDYNSKTV